MKTYTISPVSTSHDSIMKFEANYFITQHISYEFANIEEAKISPLAQQLFHLPFVKQVFLSQNFVAINKYDIVEWNDVKDEVAEQIANYLNSGSPVIKLEEKPKKMPVTVYAESTPNPAVQKFVANKKLVLQTLEFKNIDEAVHSPLATKLFNFPFVKEVFLDDNYVSITKYDRVEWQEISSELREFLRDYLENGAVIINEEAFSIKNNEEGSSDNNTATANQAVDTSKLDYVSQQIVSIIDEYVKPAVAGDGGNIQFRNYNPETQEVSVILQGACSGCPSSTITLKNGIETMLKEMLPGKISSVDAVNG